MEWGINTGNKWPLLDGNSLFTSGCSYSGETLQQDELNGIPYTGGMEMCTPKKREKMQPYISTKMVLV